MFIINLFSSVCGIVVPAILFTLFVASVVEAIEKKKKINWKLLLIAITLIGSYFWGQHTGYQKAIEEIKLIEVEGYTYTLDFNGVYHSYCGDYNYTR